MKGHDYKRKRKGSALVIAILFSFIGGLVVSEFSGYVNQASVLSEKHIGKVQAQTLSEGIIDFRQKVVKAFLAKRVDRDVDLDGDGTADQTVTDVPFIPNLFPDVTLTRINDALAAAVGNVQADNFNFNVTYNQTQEAHDYNASWTNEQDPDHISMTKRLNTTICSVTLGNRCPSFRQSIAGLSGFREWVSHVPLFSMTLFSEQELEISQYQNSIAIEGRMHSNSDIYLEGDSSANPITFYYTDDAVDSEDYAALSTPGNLFRRGKSGYVKHLVDAATGGLLLNSIFQNATKDESIIFKGFSDIDIGNISGDGNGFINETALTANTIAYFDAIMTTSWDAGTTTYEIEDMRDTDIYNYALRWDQKAALPNIVDTMDNEDNRLIGIAGINNGHGYIDEVQATPSFDGVAGGGGGFSVNPGLRIRDGVVYRGSDLNIPSAAGQVPNGYSGASSRRWSHDRRMTDGWYPSRHHPERKKYTDLRWYGWQGMHQAGNNKPSPGNPARWHFPLRSVTFIDRDNVANSVPHGNIDGGNAAGTGNPRYFAGQTPMPTVGFTMYNAASTVRNPEGEAFFCRNDDRYNGSVNITNPAALYIANTIANDPSRPHFIDTRRNLQAVYVGVIPNAAATRHDLYPNGTVTFPAEAFHQKNGKTDLLRAQYVALKNEVRKMHNAHHIYVSQIGLVKWLCKEDWNANCSNCNGTKKCPCIAGNRCHGGNLVEDCPICNYGYINCSQCNRTNHGEDPNGPLCGTCSGSGILGKIKCPTCGGDGQEPCPSHDSSPVGGCAICGALQGAGPKDIGTCGNCSSTGYKDCPSCYTGYQQCTKCDTAANGGDGWGRNSSNYGRIHCPNPICSSNNPVGGVYIGSICYNGCGNKTYQPKGAPCVVCGTTGVCQVCKNNVSSTGVNQAGHQENIYGRWIYWGNHNRTNNDGAVTSTSSLWNDSQASSEMYVMLNYDGTVPDCYIPTNSKHDVFCGEHEGTLYRNNARISGYQWSPHVTSGASFRTYKDPRDQNAGISALPDIWGSDGGATVANSYAPIPEDTNYDGVDVKPQFGDETDQTGTYDHLDEADEAPNRYQFSAFWDDDNDSSTPKVELFPFNDPTVKSVPYAAGIADQEMYTYGIYKATLPLSDRTIPMPTTGLETDIPGGTRENPANDQQRYTYTMEYLNKFNYTNIPTGNELNTRPAWYWILNNYPEMLKRATKGGTGNVPDYDSLFWYNGGPFGGYYGNDNLCMFNEREKKFVVFSELDLVELSRNAMNFYARYNKGSYHLRDHDNNDDGDKFDRGSNLYQNIYITNSTLGENVYGKLVHCGAVRLKRGRQLPENGVSISSSGPVYIWGDYNWPGFRHEVNVNSSSIVNYNVPNNITFNAEIANDWQNTDNSLVIACDSVNVLPNTWFSGGGSFQEGISSSPFGTYSNSQTSQTVSFDSQLWWEDDGVRVLGNGNINGTDDDGVLEDYINYTALVFDNSNMTNTNKQHVVGANRGVQKPILSFATQGIRAGILYGSVESKRPLNFPATPTYDYYPAAISNRADDTAVNTFWSSLGSVSGTDAVSELDWYLCWADDPAQQMELGEVEMLSLATTGASGSLQLVDYLGKNFSQFAGSVTNEESLENLKSYFYGGGVNNAFRFHTPYYNGLVVNSDVMKLHLSGSLLSIYRSNQDNSFMNRFQLGAYNPSIYIEGRYSGFDFDLESITQEEGEFFSMRGSKYRPLFNQFLPETADDW